MTVTRERLQYLLNRHLHKTITRQELREFLLYANNPQYTGLLQDLADDHFASLQDVNGDDIDWEQMYRNIIKPVPTAQPVRKLPIYRWAAAAIFLVLLGMGMYLVMRPLPRMGTTAGLTNDVAPGYNQAILTLADGSSIALDSNGNRIIQQAGVKAVQQGGGLQYSMESDAAITAYNKLSTPRGGQFYVALSDGSKVWMNAASSLRYPTVFSGAERSVQINGEAYFEIAPDANRPFRVIINDGTTIEVLGTHFNVEAYEDEEGSRTTLLEGSVKIMSVKGEVILQPGEQVFSRNAGITVVKDVAIDNIMAWKHGSFSFEGKSLEMIMRQLSRWYDIDVVYQGEIPALTFGGEMGRDVQLSGVLTFLQESGLHFSVDNEERRIVVTR